MSVRDFVSGQPWAILPSVLDQSLAIIDAFPEAAIRRLTPESIASQSGKKMDGGRDIEKRDGVAVIPIHGPIARHMGLMQAMCGGATIESLAKDLDIAVQDPKIKAILLEIDSPGGEANGIGEMAAMIRRACETKPCVAYCSNLACSAAYWLASAASEVVCNKTASLGSIGTVVQMNTKAKPGDHVIVSSRSPMKCPDPEKEDGLAEIQSWVDALSDQFINDVATYRGVTPETVTTDFGRGGLKVGQAAVDAGMADGTGDFETVLARLSSGEKAVQSAGKPKKIDPATPSVSASAKPHGDPSMSFNPLNVLGRIFAKNPAIVTEAIADADGAPESFGKAILASAGTLSVQESVEDIEARLTAKITGDLKRSAEAATRKTVEAVAAQFVASALTGGHILPAEAARLTAVYVAHAMDDYLNGPISLGEGMGSTTRLAEFTSSITARAPHGLTGDTLKTDAAGLAAKLGSVDGKVLSGEVTAEQAKLAASDRRLKEMLAGTDVGRAALKAASGDAALTLKSL